MFIAIPCTATLAHAGVVLELVDGSTLKGELGTMANGVLQLTTDFQADAPVAVAWGKVQTLASTTAVTIVLKDRTELTGSVEPAGPGGALVSAPDGPVRIDLAEVEVINPPDPLVVTGNLSAGFSLATGNTERASFDLLGDVVASDFPHRFTLRGAYHYAEDEEEVTARNWLAGLKYDHFVSERTYLFGATLFEEDTFQDLELRTALTAGVGYQLVKPGDCAPGRFEKMLVDVELGAGYFIEEYEVGEDKDFPTGRWALGLTWPVDDRLTVFHRHEIFPGLEDIEDVYINTEQGVRLSLFENFLTTLQVNWNYDNTPSAGFDRTDTRYLMSFGYLLG